MARLEFNGVVRVALVVLSVGVIGGVAVALVEGSNTKQLTMAAGARSGESYLIGSALKKVVERHYPKIRLTLLETGGTVESLRMLSAGRVQLATAQADVLAGPEARMIATLYDDEFQLLVGKESKIKTFADLRGGRIALAKNGGQFQSFLRAAEHFGMHETDFQFVGGSDDGADEAFLSGRADAIFRVRALGNPSIQRLVRAGGVRFVPIDHAAAMAIRQPAFEAGLIPEGAYSGSPAVPERDLPTVRVRRTLLARDDADADAIRAITGVLMERREEIMREIPAQMTEVQLLLAQVRRPAVQAGLGPPLHAGASAFYDKDKPSFLLAHADYVGLMLTVVLMAASWIWELKRWIESKQKHAADEYSNRVVGLMSLAEEAVSLGDLDGIWRQLVAILAEAVRDLDADKLSEESFHSFRAILQIGMDVVRDRRIILGSAMSRAASVLS